MKVDTTCVIDDDPISVFGMKRTLKEIDFCENILVFNNGLDAVNGLQDRVKDNQKLPSVIFLDLNMPIMDGWDFLEEFAKIPNPNADRVSIYIISSSVDPRDLMKAKTYTTVSNYLVKPITPQDLAQILKEYVV